MPSEVARNELVLSRSAVYATPFDLAYFEELRKVSQNGFEHADAANFLQSSFVLIAVHV